MELFLFMALLLVIVASGSSVDSDEEEESDDNSSLDLFRPSRGVHYFIRSHSGYDPSTGDWWRNRFDMTVEDD